MVDSLEKNSLYATVMFFGIYLQINNEYSNVPIGKKYKYKVRMNCNNFVFVDSLHCIYKNVYSPTLCGQAKF